jgi:hypothetical protein
MQLAELNAKPDANPANTHPINAWSCQLCHQPCAPPPFAELVSNPTPPGQITRERPPPVDDQLDRESGSREVRKLPGLMCEAGCFLQRRHTTSPSCGLQKQVQVRKPNRLFGGLRSNGFQNVNNFSERIIDNDRQHLR